MARTHFILAALSCTALISAALAQCPPERLLSPSEAAVRFGEALAVNDRHLIIGDPHDNTLCPTGPSCSNGWAWAYTRQPDGSWELLQDIIPADLAPSWAYGWAATLDGDRAIITALQSTSGPGVGVPYVFEFDGERWVEVGALFPPDTRGLHGGRLALHGDTALVGRAEGKVLVYERVDGRWVVRHDLYNQDSIGVRSDFGWSIDLDDDWIVIGAPVERVTADNGGAVYVYRRLPGGGLELAQKLVAPDILEGPRFGDAVALRDGVLAIGAPLADRTEVKQGVVYIYEMLNSEWLLSHELQSTHPRFQASYGTSIGLDADFMTIGARTEGTAVGTGAVYTLQRQADGFWRPLARLESPYPWTFQFGFPLAITGTQAVVAAPTSLIDGIQRGAVEFYDLACLLCKPDLDGDGTLTIFDFLTFQNLFAAGDMQADFDGDGELTIFDFLAFQTAFAAGCE